MIRDAALVRLPRLARFQKRIEFGGDSVPGLVRKPMEPGMARTWRPL